MVHQRQPMKPTPPTWPKRPLKPKGDLTVIQEADGDISSLIVDMRYTGDAGSTEVDDDQVGDEFMQDMDLNRFEQML